MSPEWGGPVEVVIGLTTALGHHDIRCEIATTTGHRVGRNLVDIPSVPIHAFQVGKLARVWTGYANDISHFFKSRIPSYDIVHVHEVWHFPAYAAIRAARKHQIPYVITPHGALNEWNLNHKRLRKKFFTWAVQHRILAAADALHAITPAEVLRMGELGYSERTFLAPNGVTTESYDCGPYREELEESFPILRDKRIILYLGRLTAKKGLDILARIFVNVARDVPDSILLVVGPEEDDSKRRMKEILQEANVIDRTLFTGMLTGRQKLAAQIGADAFVLPSHSEGLSIAVLEAMAAGLPVVISDNCNLPEVAEHQAGFVLPLDAQLFSDAITRILIDDAIRHSMGANGRALVKNRYSWRSTAAVLSNIYSTVME